MDTNLVSKTITPPPAMLLGARASPRRVILAAVLLLAMGPVTPWAFPYSCPNPSLQNLMHARYYAGIVGRFLSPDKIAGDTPNPQSLNRYVYGLNNPVVYTDPLGLVVIRGLGMSDVEAQDYYVQAREYLNESKTGKATMDKMESLKGEKEVTVVVHAGEGSNRDQYEPKIKTIYWNPTSGQDVSGEGGKPDPEGGTVQSPAVQLVHEAGHAVGDAEDPAGFDKRLDAPDPTNVNKEEKRVVEQVETPTARQLQEPTRQSSGGTFVETKGPTSKEPVKKRPPSPEPPHV